ncbi:DNA topoisomerase 4 subunit B [Methylorubrum populi]|uniref:Uncharacterized protein n=2 Tax=Methylobacteriaceae TaxID=119045 RepID=A0AA37HQZ4_9HYPH|nr:hypothetical protein [Methylobacterium gregans]BAU90584.1 DNA topoisomerase 4 subunit B [Methylorubrum populi]GJD80200.1 hypothetical protein NBEOAGPD_3440 [Methylobacterium gregans]GLS52530.1 hypothetical protein GCM10007886_07130 [Methylobacterium gregans]
MRERWHALSDPEVWERPPADALADETSYDAETALRVLRGMTPPKRRAGFFQDGRSAARPSPVRHRLFTRGT